MKTFKVALFGAMLAAGASCATAALSADPGFCRDYARSAVGQFREAESHERCRDRIQDLNVWSDNWQHHYGWCLGVPRDQAWAGRRQRDDFLDACREHHHHDDDDNWRR
jgi:hypothetical protein